MRFEKWQALGNDYLIVERAELPWELTPERIVALCHRNLGPGGDGILLLEPGSEGATANLRIFNPDGSEASLSGNGAREAAMYLHHRGWTAEREFTILTASGPVVPTILDSRTCSMALGRASTRSTDFPEGTDQGRGTIEVAGIERDFQFVDVGNPQLAISIPDADELEELDLPAVGPALEHDERFPNRTNVSFWRWTGDSVRARIFERGVGETLSSGTGASGAATAAHLAGAPSTLRVDLDGGELTVELDVELNLRLTGWAIPLYAAQLSPELEEDLK